MSLIQCPVQECCIHYETGDNKPKNNDVRNKYRCRKYVRGCEMALYVETQIMGLTVACDINKGKR